MKAFRKVLFWSHLAAGICGGIVIFIMCVTGAALSFEKNILEYVESPQRTVAAGENRLPVSQQLAAVLAAKPNAKPSAVAVTNDPTAATAVSLGREGQIFVNPYTAEVTGEGNKGVRGFFGFMTDLHRYIAMSGDGRPIGKAITGACNLMFLFLAISGIYIWMPRRFTRKHLRPVMWFRKTESGKARDFNWHNTIGFWSSLVLVILTVTASVISYQWASNLLYTVTGNTPPPAQQPQQAPQGQPQQERPYTIASNVDELWAAGAAHTSGWKSLSLRLPVTKDAVFTIDEGKSWNIFARSTLTLEAATAAVAKWDPYEARNGGQQLRSWFRFTHTGESFGIVGQLVGFLACLGGAVLVYTGFALAFRRFAAWLRKRSDVHSAAGVEPEPTS